ncbi:putative bifunctional diguanylate cyclase/phosphodiesterase [Bacillus alkalicellulosilyticus]|uniref:putative bifunctional diguanylate cyclase/phosphodiesterase n=1 Tax=Alkalihalobacterium alkalicellulosilyticum TaxID=1912214 RepID=UPI001483266F|nr:EAL domain-containing protein [Bacillus alkalicellulosilyticus]
MNLKANKVPILETHKLFIYVILVAFAFILKVNNFHFVYGVTIVFSSIFLLVIVRLFGLRIGVSTAVAIHLVSVFFFGQAMMDALVLLEVLFIGLIGLYKKRGNLVLWDLFFWLSLGIPLFVIAYCQTFDTINSSMYFQVTVLVTNGLLNALIADIILTYFPFSYFLNKKIGLREFLISSHQILFHLLVVAVIFPFILNVGINSWNMYETNRSQAISTSLNNANRVGGELSGWAIGEKHKLELFGLIQTGLLEDFINRLSFEESYEIVVLDYDYNVISASGEMELEPRSSFHWKEVNENQLVDDNFYQSLPKNDLSFLSINTWSKGYYIYEKKLDSPQVIVNVLFPISVYQSTVFGHFMDQFRFLLLFAVAAVVFAVVMNRILVRTISHLAETTTGLPKKLKQMELVEWPNSHLVEMKSLITNFQHMSENLKQLFEDSYSMNQELEEQANKLKKSEEELHKLAYYDVLTELPNRLHFQQHLKILLENEYKEEEKIAVVFVDMNQFKQINDTLGHSSGDQLLKLVAERFSSLKNERMEVFRLGGDEFVFVAKQLTIEEIKLSCREITDIFSEPVILNGSPLYVSGSIGVSIFPDNGTDIDTLVKYADMAMYNSKENGGNQVQFFDDSMKKEFSERMVINNGLREALDENQFELYYQPKIDSATREVTSMEALMRWSHPQLGAISPAMFIPIAEESGIIIDIDNWGIHEACRQNKVWQNQGAKKIPVSVNLSAKHFYQDNIVGMIQSAIDSSGLEPKYLQIEITESILIKNMDEVVKIIERIHNLGVQVSIDDFGIGYSSLNHLLQLPINEVKLDREFIRSIDENKKKASMVKVIVELAHSLGLNVVAEGVETNVEYEFLQQVNCDEIQGYYFSKPLSKEDFWNMLKHDVTYKGVK